MRLKDILTKYLSHG
jgi:hypothetical protein